MLSLQLEISANILCEACAQSRFCNTRLTSKQLGEVSRYLGYTGLG